MTDLTTVAREAALDALSDLAHDYAGLAEILEGKGEDDAQTEALSDAIEAVRAQLMAETVLIWSNQHERWWRANERGYTSHIDEAGRYPLAVAERIVDQATVSGQLFEVRADSVTGRRYREYDEVIVPLPLERYQGVPAARCDTCSGTGQVHEEGQPTGVHGGDVPCPDCRTPA